MKTFSLTFPTFAAPKSPSARLRHACLFRYVVNALAVIVLVCYVRAWERASKVSYLYWPEVGRPAPTFSLPKLDGQAVHLSGFRGRNVYLEFFKTGCPISQAELPLLDQWAANHPEVTVLAVSPESHNVVAEYISQNRLTHFTTLLDSGGRTWEAYGVYGTPTSFVLTADGRLGYIRAGGPARYDQFDLHLQELGLTR